MKVPSDISSAAFDFSRVLKGELLLKNVLINERLGFVKVLKRMNAI